MENTPKKRGRKPKNTEPTNIVESVPFCEQIKPKTKGILLIALGHVQYGNMAYNLANSLKYNNKDIPIHLVYTESAFSQVDNFSNFDTKQICPKEYYTNIGQTVYIKAKTHMLDLTPFDETIFIDVDTIIFGGKNLNKLFEEFKDLEFTSENYGLIKRERKDPHFWFNIQDAIAAYDFKHDIYEICTQFLYFKKTDKVKEFFEVVKDVYVNPKIKGTKFDSYLPDEMAFNIATGLTGIKPHKAPYKLMFWEKTDTNLSWSDVVKNYIGYSIGGNYISSKASTIYHNLAKAQSNGKKFYRIFSKANWNLNRRKI
jgi:hypothetical protein